jgi:hypothetical protein
MPRLFVKEEQATAKTNAGFFPFGKLRVGMTASDGLEADA